MKNIVEKFNVKSYVLLVSFVVMLAGFILSIVSNSVYGYAITNYGLVVTFSILALLAVCGSVYLLTIKKDLIATILILCAILLLVASGVIIISARAELIGTLWVTALDSVNPMANRAMNTGFPASVIYVVSALMLVVSGFLKD